MSEDKRRDEQGKRRFSIDNVLPIDTAAIKSLLASAELPTADLPEVLDDFLAAREGSSIVGCAGIEVFGKNAILRSVAVAPSARGSGLGQSLVDRALGVAQSRGVQDVWLLTQTADRFFRKFGFEVTDRRSAPQPIQGSTQFRETCPSSAVCMKLSLA